MLEDRLAWLCSSVPSRPAGHLAILPPRNSNDRRGFAACMGISSQIRAPPADRNPEIVDQIVFPLGAAASDLEPIAGRSVDELVGAGGNAAPDLNRSGAEMTEELDESGTTAEEQAVAEAPQYEAEPAGANEGTPRGVRRRPKHAHHR
jgi:hypothetical protein